jgi:hypothetical protein
MLGCGGAHLAALQPGQEINAEVISASRMEAAISDLPEIRLRGILMGKEVARRRRTGWMVVSTPCFFARRAG